MAKGIKTGGRRKGTPNRLTRDVQVLMDAVFSKVDPIKKLEALLASESDKVQAGVLLRLLEYRYGRPKESVEHTIDKDVVERLIAARKRAYG